MATERPFGAGTDVLSARARLAALLGLDVGAPDGPGEPEARAAGPARPRVNVDAQKAVPASSLVGAGYVIFVERSGIQCLAASREARDRKSTRLNSSHIQKSRMPSSA